MEYSVYAKKFVVDDAGHQSYLQVAMDDKGDSVTLTAAADASVPGMQSTLEELDQHLQGHGFTRVGDNTLSEVLNTERAAEYRYAADPAQSYHQACDLPVDNHLGFQLRFRHHDDTPGSAMNSQAFAENGPKVGR